MSLISILYFVLIYEIFIVDGQFNSKSIHNGNFIQTFTCGFSQIYVLTNTACAPAAPARKCRLTTPGRLAFSYLFLTADQGAEFHKIGH